MKVSDVKDIAMLGALGVGVYFLWKFINKIPSGADVSRATTEVANLIGPRVQALGQIRLPNGLIIAVNDVVKAGGVIDGAGNFTWQGARYTISGTGPDGIYEVM